MAPLKLIGAMELYRTRAFFSLARNLYSVFIASISEAGIEENLCAEPSVILRCDVGDERCGDWFCSCVGRVFGGTAGSELRGVVCSGVFVGEPQ